MMKHYIRRFFYGVSSSILLAACVSAQAAAPPSPSQAEASGAEPASSFPQEISKEATGVFGGNQIAYTANLERIGIVPNGLPAADIVTISYVAETEVLPAERPVLFIFNGGPISASLWLHIGALGPKRVSAPEDLSAPLNEFKLVDNPYSPLDAADLVFFDPASTGFSRVTGGGDPSEYFSVEADAAQFAAFAEAWLARHGRSDAPVFILGESYGTHRAAEAAGQIAETGRLNFGGVFLMGQAVNIVEYSQRKQNIISYVASLPTLAAIAWDVGAVDRRGLSVEEFVAEAQAFGEAEYLGALFKGQRISEEELDTISAKLEVFTGISAEYYVRSRLRISKEQFRTELLKAEEKILGRSDGRYTGPLEDGRGDPSGILQAAYWDGFSVYFSGTFEGVSLEGYNQVFSAGPGFDSWNWGASSPFGHFAYAEGINAAFDAYPDFRLFVGTGYHDTMTTVGAADYLIDQSDWPPERVRSGKYIGGHMAYSVDESARQFGDDIRSWIRGWNTP